MLILSIGFLCDLNFDCSKATIYDTSLKFERDMMWVLFHLNHEHVLNPFEYFNLKMVVYSPIFAAQVVVKGGMGATNH